MSTTNTNGNGLSILIAAKLKETTTVDIETQLKEVQEKLKGFALTVDLKFNDVSLKQLETLKNKTLEVSKTVEKAQKQQADGAKEYSKALQQNIADIDRMTLLSSKRTTKRDQDGNSVITGYQQKYFDKNSQQAYNVKFDSNMNQVSVDQIKNYEQIQKLKEQAQAKDDAIYNKELTSFKAHVDQMYNLELTSFQRDIDLKLKQQAEDDKLYNKELESFRKYNEKITLERNRRDAKDYNSELSAHKNEVSSKASLGTIIDYVPPGMQNIASLKQNYQHFGFDTSTIKNFTETVVNGNKVISFQAQALDKVSNTMKTYTFNIEKATGILRQFNVVENELKSLSGKNIGNINPTLQNEAGIKDFLTQKYMQGATKGQKLEFGPMKDDGDKWSLVAKKTDEATKKVTQYAIEAHKASGAVQQVASTVSDLKEKSTGINFGEKFSNALASMGIWMSAATVFFGTIRSIQAGLDQIKQLDVAMTDLKKVTDETSATYRDFYMEANKIGDTLGKTTIEVVQATAEFARLGYSLKQAKVLAQEAILYSNVGGISVQESSQTLISAIKGFGIAVDSEGKNIRRVTDIYNEVGNNFAITSQGVGEAISRSASTLHEAGNTIEEAVAMITAANNVVQDPEVVGTALKTVSMRIRGVSEETGVLGEELPKLENAFASIGLTLRKDSNTFKSTFEIMSELAGVWKDLTDIKRADILTKVAGQRQGNIIAGLLNNWQDAQKVLEAAMNSAGSVTKEQEKYMESLEFKSKQFQNALLGFWQSTINSAAVGSIIKLGTSLIGVITTIGTKIGLLPIVIGVLTLAWQLNNKMVVNAITGLVTWVTTTIPATIAANGGLIASLGVLGTTLISTFAPVLAITAAVWALKYAYDAYQETKQADQDRIKHLGEERSHIDDQIKSVTSLVDQYEKLQAVKNPSSDQRSKLLDLQKQMNDVLPESIKGFTDEGKAIQLTTLEIKDQIEKLKERRGLMAGQEADLKTAGLVDQGAKIDKAKTEISNAKDKLNNAEAEQAVFEYIAKNYDKNKSIIQNSVDLQKEIDKIYSEHGAYTKATKGLRQNAFRTIQDSSSNSVPIGETINEALAKSREEVAKVKTSFQDQEKIIEEAKANFGKIFNDRAIETTSLVPNDTQWEKFATQFSQKYLESVSSVISKGNATSLASDFQDQLSKIFDLRKQGKLKLDLLDKDSLKADIDAVKKAGLSVNTLEVAMSLLEGKQKQEKIATYDNAIATTELLTAYESTGKELDSLADAYVKVAHGKSLTLTEINSLVHASPQLLQHLKLEHGQLTLTQKGIMEVMRARQADLKVIAQEAIETAKANKSILESNLDTALKSMKLIGDVAKVRKEGISVIWAEYQAQHPDLLNSPGIMHASDAISKQFGPLIDQLNKSEETIKGLQQSAEAIAGADLVGTAIKAAEDKSNGGKPTDPFKKNEFEHRSLEIDRDMAIAEAEMARLEKTDKRYNEVQKHMIDLMTQKRDLAHAEAEDIRNIQIPAIDAKIAAETDDKEVQKLKKERDDLQKKIPSLQQTWTSINSQIDSIKLGDPINQLDKAVEKYEKNVRKLDDSLALLDNRQIGLKTTSQGYRDNLEEQNKVLRDKIGLGQTIMKSLKDEEASIESRLKTEELTAQARKTLEDRLNTIRDKMSSINGEILNLNGSIRKNNQTIVDSEQEYKDKALAIAEKAIDAYRKIAEDKKKIELDAIDVLEKAEDKRHKKVVDAIDEEIKAFESLVNAKLKTIDREGSKDDFNRNLEKATNERNDVQRQISLLSLDDSPEAKAKRKELEKKLLDANEKIEDLKRNRSKDIRKEGLQDQLDEFKKSKESEKKIEDSNFKNTMDGYKKQRDEIEATYQQEINNEILFSEWRKKAQEGDFSFLKGKLTEYFQSYDSLADTYLKSIGGKVKEQISLANELKDIIKEADNYTKNNTPPSGGSSGGSGGGSGDNGGGQGGYGGKTIEYGGIQYNENTALDKYIKNKVRWIDVQHETGKDNTPEQQASKAMNDFFRTQFNFQDFDIDWLRRNGYISFDTGGYTGDWGDSNGRLGVLHKKELILKENDTKNLLATIEHMRNFTTPAVAQISNLPAVSNQDGRGPLIGSIQLTIEKLNGTEKDAQFLYNSLVKKVNNSLKRKGQLV